MASGSRPMPGPPGPQPHHWEGDGTLHHYCYDYMRKRGWFETASAFAADVGINESEWKGPPIEAPQGLLYEWWSVFWDVFIARSQKTGARNAMADNYVDAMRAKKDNFTVHFAGQPNMQPLSLPRSIAHPPRGVSQSSEGGPLPRQFGPPLPMRVMSQGQEGMRMPPPGAQRPPPGGPPPQYHTPPPQNFPPQQAGGGPQHHQGGPHSQAPPPNMHLQQSQSNPNYPQTLPQTHPLQQYHQQPPASSVHSSPHLANAPHPYGNGNGPRPQPTLQQQRLQELPGSQGHGPMASVFAQSMAAVGLQGRDPESLNQEEQNAVRNQMRKVGALPPLPPPQAQYRGPPPPQLQRGPPPAQQLQQQGGQQQYTLMTPAQQQERAQQQHMEQQMRMRREGMPNQIHYPPSQHGSPASPYASLPQHMPPPPNQASPPSNFQPPAPQRTASKGVPRGAASAKMSPANSKRGGPGQDDPSPRSKKRARGATKDDEMPLGPETPRFDMSGPSSPATGVGIGLPTQGTPGGPQQPNSPYRPAPSPSQLAQDASARGAMDALNTANARMLQQQHNQQQQQHHVQEPMINDMNGGRQSAMGLRPEDFVNGGDINLSMNGMGANGISRPGSSTANYLNPGQQDGKPTPKQSPDGAGSMHITLPPPLPPSSFQLAPGASGAEGTTPGGRPFAGAAVPPPFQPAAPPAVPTHQLGQPSDDLSAFQYNTGDDAFGDLNIDLAFETFMNGDLFDSDEAIPTT